MTDSVRFYGAGMLVCGVLLLTAGVWLGAQEGSARTVALTAFAVAFGVAASLVALRTRDESSSVRQDPGAPGNRMYWRLLVGGVFLTIFDDALSGVPIFSATGFMTGFIGSILVATFVRAQR